MQRRLTPSHRLANGAPCSLDAPPLDFPLDWHDWQVFSAADRDRIRDYLLALATEDERIVAGAIVGSAAAGAEDRWSDLDLTFAVSDAVPVTVVLEDWTRRVVEDLDGVTLFDLPSGQTIYRVFLLPDGLQCDLSFSPAAHFGAAGPRFRLLFGSARDLPVPLVRPAFEIFGWAVAYARDARACIDRGRLWQAEHCASAVRDHALQLACLRRGLPTRFGRGIDDLPADVVSRYEATIPSSLDLDELLRTLERSVDCLLDEALDLVDVAASAEPRIRTWFD